MNKFNWPSPFSVPKVKQVGATRASDFITAQYFYKLASLSNFWLASSHFPLSTFTKEASWSLWQLWKLENLGRYAKHDWKCVILKPIHSKSVDHHVRVACVQKNSNLLRYFNKCIAINSSYSASPLENGSNQFFGQKHHHCDLSRNLDKSWATGHKPQWLI